MHNPMPLVMDKFLERQKPMNPMILHLVTFMHMLGYSDMLHFSETFLHCASFVFLLSLHNLD
jgi:hypothetical protein